MVDFRYHLVSIVAVFLALGLGLLLGSTELKPYVAHALKYESSSEENKIKQELTTNGQLRFEMAREGDLAVADAPVILANVLAGERVVIVDAPNAPTQVDSFVTQAVKVAGGTVTGRVELQPQFLTGTASQTGLGRLATKLALPGTSLASGSPLTLASRVLGSALVTRDGPGAPVAGQRSSGATAAVNGFARADFLSLPGNVPTYANLAVLVLPPSPVTTSDNDPEGAALVTLAAQFEAAGQGVVVAGSVNGSGSGSAVNILRTQPQPSRIGTVDDADQPGFGEITVAQALYEQLHGKGGSYGMLPSASSGAGPSPAPSASPTLAPVARKTLAAGLSNHSSKQGNSKQEKSKRGQQ